MLKFWIATCMVIVALAFLAVAPRAGERQVFERVVPALCSRNNMFNCGIAQRSSVMVYAEPTSAMDALPFKVVA